MSIELAYVHYCDDNDLLRLDATPEQKLANVDRMASELMNFRLQALKEIANRCPHCNGTGRNKAME